MAPPPRRPRPTCPPCSGRRAARRTRSRADTQLTLQGGDEGARLGQAVPHLGQEGGAPLPVAQGQAVDAGTQAGVQLGFVGDDERLRRRKQRHLHRQARVFGAPQRRKAPVQEGRGPRVVAHVLAQGSMGLERADAAAQLTVGLQGHEGGAGPRQELRIAGGSHGQAQRLGDGAAGVGEQHRPRSGVAVRVAPSTCGRAVGRSYSASEA